MITASDFLTPKAGAKPELSTLDLTTAKPYIVDDGEFQWNDKKAATNIADHGVTFETRLARCFRTLSRSIGSTRARIKAKAPSTVVGMVKGRLLYVAYTMRGEAIRIISAPGAEPHERRQYHEDKA